MSTPPYSHSHDELERIGNAFVKYKRVHDRLEWLIDKITSLSSGDIERIFEYGSPSVFAQIMQGFVIDGNKDYLPEELKNEV